MTLLKAASHTKYDTGRLAQVGSGSKELGCCKGIVNHQTQNFLTRNGLNDNKLI